MPNGGPHLTATVSIAIPRVAVNHASRRCPNGALQTHHATVLQKLLVRAETDGRHSSCFTLCYLVGGTHHWLRPHRSQACYPARFVVSQPSDDLAVRLLVLLTPEQAAKETRALKATDVIEHLTPQAAPSKAGNAT
jgi:hypothetical protein